RVDFLDAALIFRRVAARAPRVTVAPKNSTCFEHAPQILVKRALTESRAFQCGIQVNGSDGTDRFAAVSTNVINPPTVLSSSWRARLDTTTKKIDPERTAAGPAFTRDESDPRQNVCYRARACAGDDASGIAQDRIRPGQRSGRRRADSQGRVRA